MSKLNNSQIPDTLSSKTIDNTNSIDTTTTNLSISGGSNGQVLSTDGSGNLSWATAGGGLQYFQETRNITSPNGSVPVHRIQAIGIETNIDFTLQPKGQGAILRQVPDSTSSGGNKRGIYAIDLQAVRNNAAKVAQASYSSILGGKENQINSTALYSTIVNGDGNIVNPQYSFIGGGFQNNIQSTGQYSFIGGGQWQIINAPYSFIGGGNSNNTNSNESSIVGGIENIIATNNQRSFIGGGFSNSTGSTTSIGYNVIVGGNNNEIYGDYGFVGSGINNYATGTRNSIVNGNSNTALGRNNTILGGISNTSATTADNSVVLGGSYGVARNPSQVVISTNRISTNGDSQVSFYHLKRLTNTNDPRSMQLGTPDGNTEILKLVDYQYILLNIQIIGVEVSNPANTACYEIKALVKRDNGASTTDILFSNDTILYESAGATTWEAYLNADTSNGGLLIRVKGAPTSNVMWSASVRATEVKYQ